ncbi:MAG: hypothetical protein IT447_13745 [Phycisphaerales bacterium]|nr:hypothetical protein [Phycisphaerales bacterium]
MKVVKLACALLSGGLFISQATGAVVFRDNFENANVGAGAFPQAGYDFDPVAQVGSWTIVEPAITNVQISENYSPAEGTRAMVSDRNGTGAVMLRANFASAAPVNPVDGLKISFKYKDMSPDEGFGGTTDIINLTARNSNDNNFDQQAFGLRIYKGWGGVNDVYVGFGGNGSLSNPGSGEKFAGVGDPGSNWMQVDIDMDFVNHTYTMKINNTTATNSVNVPFDGDASTANQLQQLVFDHYYVNASRWAIDDITVSTVPEPGACVVMSGLIAGVLGRRRRR